ncbi:MAG: cell envelope integrity EipB family protein [Actinomycetota bacterium]
MKRGSGLAAAALAVAVAGAASVAWAAPAELVSHRAVYRMGLAQSRSGSGMAGASGTWAYEFADSCDGWTTEYRLAMNYSYSEGGEVQSTTDFLSWESKDGLKYRFRVRQARDGQVTEEIEGTAELKGKGQPGVVRYSRPEPRTVKLPKGTVFPTEHTARLIDTAATGGHMLVRSVFDGMGEEGPYEISAVIGRNGPGEAAAAPASPLLASPAWPMRMAFFPVQSKDALPDFEMSLNYHANGIADGILQIFKTFSLRGKLESVEMLPRKKC